MAATITATASRVTISGNYKSFTGDTGSTSTVIQYKSGDAPASGDAGRFLLWKSGTDTETWEVRYIDSATTTTVTVGDGGFSGSPAEDDTLLISTNLDDVETTLSEVTVQGRQYSFNGRDWSIESGAFLADVNISLDMASSTGTTSSAGWPIADDCTVQFGRLNGGEANDSTETIEGCSLIFENDSANMLVFTTASASATDGPIVNFYGCLIESYDTSGFLFIRAKGPMRVIGSLLDGPLGGRFYHDASELVQTRFSGNIAGGVAWSLGTSFTRSISEALFYGNTAAVKAFQANDGTFRDCTFSSSNTNVVDNSAVNSDLDYEFIDCTTLVDGDFTDNKGDHRQKKSVNYTVTDSSGTGLTGAMVAIYDTNDTEQGNESTTSGAMTEILAQFWEKLHNASGVSATPFTVRLRKYDYEYQDFNSNIDEKINQEFRLPDNSVTVLSEAAAAALTGIAIDFSLETLTITTSKTMSEIYDYVQSQLALTGNMDEPEFLKSSDGNVLTFNDDWDLILGTGGDITSGTGKTIVFGGTGELIVNDAGNTLDNLTITGDISIDAVLTDDLVGLNVSGTIDFSNAGTYTLDGCTINEVTNSSGGAVTLNLTNNSTVTTNTGPSITIQNQVTVKDNPLDINGDPIENARVYLEAGSGGPITQGDEILNALTNASGIAQDTTFNYSSDQPLQNSKVRRGTSSPLYVESIISGTITSMGFEATATMVSDE